MPDAPGLLWRVKFKDDTFEFDPQSHLTARRLRQIKKIYGPDYGRYNNLVVLLAQGDVDAWASVIWICLDNAGLPKPATPDMLDFPIGELMTEAVPADEVEADDEEDEWDGSNQKLPPTPAEATPTSTLTSTDSGSDTSSD